MLMNSKVSVDATTVKKIAMDRGADLCGISPADRFEGAPKGHHPKDIYPECRSVIVFAKRMPIGLLDAKSCVPYTQVSHIINQELDKIGISLGLALEDLGARTVPLPADDPYEHWEADRQYGRAVLSMRHAGYLAGLGVMGRNTLLKNEHYGNMIKLGAILVDVEVEPDPIVAIESCPEKCHRCLDACPAKALDGTTVDQKLCRTVSGFTNEKGFFLMRCNTCRRVCPERFGIRRR